MSLANDYRPKDWGDVVEQGITTTILRNICDADTISCRNFLLTGPAGTGKAQPLYSQVLTPVGYVPMGSIVVGSKVITGNEAVAEVTGVFPQGMRPIFRITVEHIAISGNINHYTFDVADNHINVIYIKNELGDYQYREIMTCDLIDVSDYSNLYVRHIGRLTDIDPYSRIISIDYIGDDLCQCIFIDAPEHTYVTDNFIVTHNTTLARLMSNKLNDGNGEIIEIDAASHSGADAMREIVEQAKTYPVVGKYKCLIVDEAHAISIQGWQVLLKTLESSPARSIFFLCTTNPEKIPKTITSRVQQFQLSKISLDGIEKRIKYVLDSEIAKGKSITYTPDGINFIAKLSGGGMRDALTRLDKILVYSSDITSENVATALNLSNYDDYFALLNAVAKHDNSAIAGIVDTVYNSGINFIKWFEDFHSFLMNIVKYILLHDISRTMIPSHYEEKLSKYNMNHYAICLRLSNTVMQINQELRSTNYLQETVLSRLCTIPPKPKTESNATK